MELRDAWATESRDYLADDTVSITERMHLILTSLCSKMSSVYFSLSSENAMKPDFKGALSRYLATSQKARCLRIN